ncbi:MAG: hypothetical protein MUE71_11435 [Chitinophagaceae bacterium]|nr:hypothetical protein [Chitinophagaceae bacterium]
MSAPFEKLMDGGGGGVGGVGGVPPPEELSLPHEIIKPLRNTNIEMVNPMFLFLKKCITLAL